MTRIAALIILMALFPGLARAAPLTPRVSADGSLVLAGAEAKSQAAQGDTLHVLLSREVKAFIFRQQTRVWPQTRVYRPALFRRSLSNPFLEELIHKYANYYSVDPSLIRAVIRHESGGNTQAVSPKGAQGLMQLMPGTAVLMGVQDPFDPEENIAGGVGYLKRCLDRFSQNVPLAVAAYNAGPERVSQYNGVPPFAETQSFVQNVMGSYLGYSQGGTLFQKAALSSAPQKPGSAAPPAGLKKIPARVQLAQRPSHPRPKIIEVRFPKARSTAATVSE